MITDIGARGRGRCPAAASASRSPNDRYGRRQLALPSLALLLVAVTWGATFSVVEGATSTLPVADLVAWRFGLASAILLVIRRSTPTLPTLLRRRAIILGGLLGTGFLLQVWGLTYTDSVMSGFLVGTLVIIAPITGWLLFGDRPGLAVCCAVTLASAGLAMLSLRGNGFGFGEGITLAAATVWALHLVLLARWARPEHALQLARIQTCTVAVLALSTVAVGGWLTGGPAWPTIPQDTETWLSVVFLAVLATAAAMILLCWAQSRLTATRAAVILTLEPAVAGLTGALLGGEFGGRTIAGGALLIGAMVLVELGSGGRPGSGRPMVLYRVARTTSWRRPARSRARHRATSTRPSWPGFAGQHPDSSTEADAHRPAPAIGRSPDSSFPTADRRRPH